MKLLISFSGRKDGNCDQIARYLASDGDQIVLFRELEAHPCRGCGYECFHDVCRYRSDAVYGLYDSLRSYDRVFLIVPMYCGNPASLYFVFSERGQDYFMHNDVWEEVVRRLYLIGVYGSAESSPGFLPCLEQWFQGSPCQGRVLGIERHLYGQKLGDCVLDVPEVRERLDRFAGEGRRSEA